MNEGDIRTRAYFHFANRTGTNWQDPTSNWIQAEAEKKALAAAKTPDITGELFTYRPLSQLIPTLVLPAINVKVANGAILPTALPIELKRLQIALCLLNDLNLSVQTLLDARLLATV